MKNTLQVIQMEKFVRQSLLYDFYGELLTQTQKSIYEDVVMNDLSYSQGNMESPDKACLI
mgnify:CR=1 FL=1